MKRDLSFSLKWLLGGIFAGTVTWWFLAGGVYPVFAGQSVSGAVRWLFTGAWFWQGSFALITALLTAPVYYLVFLGWVRMSRRIQGLESVRGLVWGSLAMAFPFALIVAYGFAGFGFNPNWTLFWQTLPLLLATMWLGIVLPRILLPGLRPGTISREVVGEKDRRRTPHNKPGHGSGSLHEPPPNSRQEQEG